MKFIPLTPEQRRQFNDDGFLIVRNALRPEQLERLKAAGDELCASDLMEGRYRTSGSYDGFRNCLALHEVYRELLTLETTFPLVVQLLGPRIQCITSHLIHKLPNEPGTPSTFRQPGWHRDVQFTPQDLGEAQIPRMEMKVAYYLTDCSRANSAVTLFARGSNHNKGPVTLVPGTPDPEGAVEPLLNAGDAVFFENRTWHAGAPNLTSETTRAVMMGYGFSWMKPMDYLVQPEWLLESVDDFGKQLLGGLKDPAGRFVPGGIHTPLIEWCREHNVQYTPVNF